MNLKVSLVAFLLLVALSLIAFAFSFVGVPGSAVDSVWKLFALSLGVALVAGFAYPYLRGVKKGDVLSTNLVQMSPNGMSTIINLFGGPTAVAMQSGRKGDKININFQGRQAEGIVISYASTFSPAQVKITEMEQVQATAQFY